MSLNTFKSINSLEKSDTPQTVGITGFKKSSYHRTVRFVSQNSTLSITEGYAFYHRRVCFLLNFPVKSAGVTYRFLIVF